MSFFEDIRQAIEKQFSANWATTDIAWDNVEYTPNAATSFVSIKIEYMNVALASIAASPIHRATGNIIISIMVPMNTGTNTIRGYVDSIVTIFKNKKLSNIVQCLSPYTRRIGDIGEHYQMNVIVPFYADKSLANAS